MPIFMVNNAFLIHPLHPFSTGGSMMGSFAKLRVREPHVYISEHLHCPVTVTAYCRIVQCIGSNIGNLDTCKFLDATLIFVLVQIIWSYYLNLTYLQVQFHDIDQRAIDLAICNSHCRTMNTKI